MQGPGAIWSDVANHWNGVLAQVTDEQWQNPTDCEGWTVQDLVDHAYGWQAQGGAGLGANCCPGENWETVQAAIADTVADPSNLEGTAEAMGIPKHQVLGFMTGDLLVHSWDLARAIGADDALPAEAVQATLMGLERVPEEMLRAPNMFGPAVPIAEDASEQDKLIAFTGRQP